MPAGCSVGRKPAVGRQGKGPPPSCSLAFPGSITGNGSLPWRGSKLHLQSSILCFSPCAPRTSLRSPQRAQHCLGVVSSWRSEPQLRLRGSPLKLLGSSSPTSRSCRRQPASVTLPGGSCPRLRVSLPHCLKNAGKTDVCSFCCLS